MEISPDDQTIRLLLSRDTRPFLNLMKDLISNDKITRTYAEVYLLFLSNNHPEAVTAKIAAHLSSNHRRVRRMSSMLLRQFFTPASCFHLWPCLNPVAQRTLRDILLESLEGETDRHVMLIQSDTVAELASHFGYIPSHWPELLPWVLFTMGHNGPPLLVEASLRIFARLARQLADTLLPRVLTLRSVLSTCLTHPVSTDVHVAALSASCSLVQAFSPHNEQRDKLIPFFTCVPAAILGTLYLPEKGGAAVSKMLELLIELVGTEPNFMCKFIKCTFIVQQVVNIARAELIEEGTRLLAIELMISLAEAKNPAPGPSGMLRKCLTFVRELVIQFMKMLTDVDDDMAYVSVQSEDRELDHSANYTLAQESLARFAVGLGGCTLLKVASDILHNALMNPEWKLRHAALIALTQISPGCSLKLIENLGEDWEFVYTVLNCFLEPYPLVRLATIDTLAQLFIELGPNLEKRFHGSILPTLCTAMEDFENPCIQAHATMALVNFIENCDDDILTPYLDGIVTKLVLLLEHGTLMVQEGAVSALISVADASLIKFDKYYDEVMPHLMRILLNATIKAPRMLRAKSVECVTVVGLSVGQDKFIEHAQTVIKVLMSLQSSLIPDDPITTYVLESWATICKCLGNAFLPYMTFVMPPLLKSAQLEPEVGTSAGTSADVRDSDYLRTETVTVKGKRINVSTSNLEEKATACKILLTYVQVLEEDFFPWTKQVVHVLAPLVKFCYHEEVRITSARAMPELLESAEVAIAFGITQDNDESYVKEMLQFIIPGLLEGIRKEQILEVCLIILDSLNNCLQVSARLLEEHQVRSIVEEIKYLITSSDARKKERAGRMKAVGLDAEDLWFISKENELEDSILESIGECLSALIRTSKTAFLPLFDELSKYITPMLGSESTLQRRVSIGIFDDLADKCGDAARKYHGAYLPYLLVACNENDPILKQSGVFGVGVCAKFGGSEFKPFVSEALSKLNNVIQHPNALAPDHALAYDNAVSALGKICEYHRDSIKAAKVISTWLNCLPLRHDIGEAHKTHALLCSMVERSDRELLGSDNKHLPKIISVFTEILSSKEDLATEVTFERMVLFLKEVKLTMPESTLDSTLSSLNEEQELALQAVLHKYLRF